MFLQIIQTLKAIALFIFSSSNDDCVISSQPNFASIQNESSIAMAVTFRNVGNSILEVSFVDDHSFEYFTCVLYPGEDCDVDSAVGNAFRARNIEDYKVIFEKHIEFDDEVILIGKNCIQTTDNTLSPNEYKFEVSSTYITLNASSAYFENIIQRSKCKDLDQWLSKTHAVSGYHILCLYSANETFLNLEAYGNGYRKIKNITSVAINTQSSFEQVRRQIEFVFDIRRSDMWNANLKNAIARRRRSQVELRKYKMRPSKVDYLPQLWSMFSTDRHKVANTSDISSRTNIDPSIFLVFTGGQFIYPGVEVGFTRNINVEAYGKVAMTTSSLRPLVFTLSSFLSDKEMDYIIQKSKPKMSRSSVSKMDGDVDRDSTEFRTSRTFFLKSQEGDSILQSIDARVANITGTSLQQQEIMQVLQYEVGEYYLSHLDFWHPEFYNGYKEIELTHGGHRNRLSTVFWYISDAIGGQTSFPKAVVDGSPSNQCSCSENMQCDTTCSSSNYNVKLADSIEYANSLDKLNVECSTKLSVVPKRGKCIIFYNLLPNGDGDAFSEHAACPVSEGTKWAVNKWVWNANR